MTSNSLLFLPNVCNIKDAGRPTLVWYSPLPLAVTSLPNRGLRTYDIIWKNVEYRMVCVMRKNSVEVI